MNQNNLTDKFQKGFSLIELMIAMVIGLVLIGGVIGIFITTQQTNRTQEAMSRVQESGRIAIEILARDIRESGQFACSGSINDILRPIDPGQSNIPNFFFENRNPFSNPTPISESVNNSAILSLNRFGSEGTFTVGNSGNSDNNVQQQIQVQPNHTLKHCQLLMVVGSGGTQCEIFTNNVASPNQVGRNPGNCPNSNYRNRSPSDNTRELIDYPSGETIEIFNLVNRSYFVGTASHNNVRSLFRSNNILGREVTQEELVEGIFEMQIEYGVDTSGDSRADMFVFSNNLGSNPNWNSFVAVRIHILAYSGELNNVVDTPQVITFAGQQRTMPDRRLYQSFTTTISVRNARRSI